MEDNQETEIEQSPLDCLIWACKFGNEPFRLSEQEFYGLTQTESANIYVLHHYMYLQNRGADLEGAYLLCNTVYIPNCWPNPTTYRRAAPKDMYRLNTKYLGEKK